MTKFSLTVSLLISLVVLVHYGRRPEGLQTRTIPIPASVARHMHFKSSDLESSSQTLTRNFGSMSAAKLPTSPRPKLPASGERLEALDEVLIKRTIDLIAKDDICETLKLIEGSTGRVDDMAMLHGMLEALGRPNDISVLSLREADPKDKSESAQHQNFLAALKYSGLLLDHENAGDLHRSHQLLSRLMQEHPDNGAYAFYKLHVDHLLKAKPEEIGQTLQKIASARYFDSHLNNYYRDIIRHSVDSASLLALMHHTVKYLPSIDHDRLAIYTEGARELQALKHAGRLMMEEGLNSPTSHITYGFSKNEYIIGQWFQDEKYPSLEEVTVSQLPENIQEYKPPHPLNFDSSLCNREQAMAHVNYMRAYLEQNYKGF